ncbi:uncharacterized protein DUF2784 [Stackebrandtia albiflava]|uniref:Uncharacterized protein DUF2784 n=1 Tax=Stackebrandtia albiflava TaxID=406432 RepID=A0A562URK0_9ACTN|nr:DUF2784 domain-containing protein [Stackebrandtia albiflava]TWJ08240.1 uncharacterized protein DUF2784 [Stackebrandtia albiflava]
MLWRILSDITMVVHFLVLAYLVVGGFLAWRWPRMWFPHLAMALWGLAAIMFPVICPLTYLENLFRDRAGQNSLDPGGFIDQYLTDVVYPGEHLILVRWIVVAVIAVSWAGAWWRWRRRTGAAR